jgi:hypothetical protein
VVAVDAPRCPVHVHFHSRGALLNASHLVNCATTTPTTQSTALPPVRAFSSVKLLVSFLLLPYTSSTQRKSKMYSKPEEPEVPDYYAALGVSQDATNTALKKAFHALALKYHPDKLAPGETVDAVEFRKVSETYLYGQT